MRAHGFLPAVVLVASSLWGYPAAAAPRWADEASEIVLHGWTEDGRFVVYERTEHFLDDPSSGEGEDCRLVTRVVLDGASGERQEYLVLMTGDRCVQTRARAAKLGKLETCTAWSYKHPRTLLEGEQSPDQKVRAVVTVKAGEESQAKGAWTEGRFKWGPAAEGDALSEVAMTLSAERAGKRWPVAEYKESSAGNLHGEVSVAWSPDNKRAAWVLHRGYAMLNDFGFARLAVTPAAGPRIELLGSKAVLGAARTRVEQALDGGGFAIIRAGRAQKDRVKSVVYAARGSEDVAKEVAALLPGGATVEPLTWSAFGDLVIALGESAAR